MKIIFPALLGGRKPFHMKGTQTILAVLSCVLFVTAPAFSQANIQHVYGESYTMNGQTYRVKEIYLSDSTSQ